MIANANLDCIFNPESVAIVGVSTDETITNVGRIYLEALTNCGFRGQIYPVNPKGGEIQGLKIYAGIKDIPGPVDYVISCIPAPLTPGLTKECVSKEVKAMQFFTSGFGESGTEEGRQIQQEIYTLAHQGGVRLIGPNCMGVYCPKSGLSFAADFSKESGSVAFVSQSGGNAIHLGRFASQRGIRFSKMISYGNACDINESDLIEYLTDDPETEVIAAYIEGVKDGARFYRVLKRAADVKPVIVLKGGYTEVGGIAAASHTGALAGSGEVWENLLRQAGAIRVYNLDEMVELAITFLHMSLPAGRRLAVTGIGGGAAVMATDDCTSAGFFLPRLPEEIQKEIRSLLVDDAGTFTTNPVDISGQIIDEGLAAAVNPLSRYEGIDFILIQVPIGILLLASTHEEREVIFSSTVDTALKARAVSDKPIAIVFHASLTGSDYESVLSCQQKCYEAGIPVYHSISGAARAIDRFISYHERRGER